MKKILLLFFLLPIIALAQKDSISKKETGKLMLGMRSTISAFSDAGYLGMGTGGQFRLRFGSRMNSDWFADYITTDIGGLARRTDYHIGWSVLCYPFNYKTVKGKFTPYILAGHCFDWTRVEKNGYYTDYNMPQSRFSSAVQGGIGAHYNLADNFDISLTAQYMLHLGKDIRTTIFYNDATQGNDIKIEKGDLGLDGHLLINLSVNIYVAKLWGRKSK
ncbi:MAG: outer membrane beta-barrel protein [Bacteroidetes bacterium]|nr:outer membrane beta-barrel protein [Bacteroidota bacterium]